MGQAYYHYSEVTDEEKEAQRGEAICLEVTQLVAAELVSVSALLQGLWFRWAGGNPAETSAALHWPQKGAGGPIFWQCQDP